MSEVTFPVAFYGPGQLGINYQEEDQLLNPAWATVAQNLVLTKSRQLAARGGFEEVSTTPAAAPLLRTFVYIDNAGAEIVISTRATAILYGTNVDLTNATYNISSSTSPTAGYWQFANFNGKVLGWQDSHTPIVKTTGDFADITAASGTLPTGDCVCAAFGRVWAVASDRQTVRYSALLDETLWATADGGGAIDMRNVWTRGIDVVMGIAAFGANLIIFGRRHIIIYSDGQGSAQGMDPDQAYVVDTIEGTGLLSRDTIAAIGEGDLVFLSTSGQVQSLRRLVQDKDNPLQSISWQIEDYLAEAAELEINFQAVAEDDCRAFTGRYIESTGQYLLTRSGTFVNEIFAFHMLERTKDDLGRDVVPITHWERLPARSITDFCEISEGNVYSVGMLTEDASSGYGSMLEYVSKSTQDFFGTDIATDFESPWVLFGQQEIDTALKILKTLQVTVLNPQQVTTSLIAKYGFDYSETLDTITALTSSDSSRIIEQFDCTGDVEGQYFKFGVKDSAGGGKSLQSVSLYMKPTRLAFIHDKENQGLEGTESASRTNVLVAVGSGSPYLMRSTDAGASWASPATLASGHTSVIYIPTRKRFLAMGNNVGSYSSDLTTWTAVASPPFVGDNAVAMAWCEKYDRVIVAPDGPYTYTSGMPMYYSDDGGATWTQCSFGDTITAGAATMYDVVWWEKEELFLAVGTTTYNSVNREMMYSADGITWNLIEGALSMTTLAGSVEIIDKPSVAMAAGSSTWENSAFSSDGKFWSLLLPEDTYPPFTIQDRCLAWSPTRSILVGFDTANNSVPWSSKDLKNWTARSALSAIGVKRVRWLPTHKRFVAVGTGVTNHVAYSLNGTSYTQVAAVSGDWLDVCEGVIES